MLSHSEYTWHQPKRWGDWWPFIWLPGLVFVGFFVWFQPLQFKTAAKKTIDISLQTPVKPTPQQIPANVEPKPIAEVSPETVPERQPEAVKVPNSKPQLNIASPSPPTETQAPKNSQKPVISSGILFNQAKQHTDIRITDEFKAGSSNDYKPLEVTAHNPYEDIPYQTIKPLRMDLNFYANGYRGDMQRFGDAITLEKTFTTRYGTKIKCALVVIFMGCSWK